MDGLVQLDSGLATDDEDEFLWGSGGIGYVVSSLCQALPGAGRLG